MAWGFTEMGIVEIPPSQESGKVRSLSFVCPDKFKQGLSIKFGEWPGTMRTARPGMYWMGSKWDDISIQIELVAGGSDAASWTEPAIETGEDLVRFVQWLYDLGLPPSVKTKGTRPVILFTASHQTGARWFQCRGYLSKVGSNWKEPVDVDSGVPIRCELSFSFRPYWGKRIVIGEDMKKPGVQKKYMKSVDERLPRRPFRFDRLGE